MLELEKLNNKEFAYRCLNILKEKGCLNDEEIYLLTNEDECKKRFSCSKFPILNEVSVKGPIKEEDCYDEKGRQRFYKERIYVLGRAFVVTNHWYGPNKAMADNRTPFMNWVLQK